MLLKEVAAEATVIRGEAGLIRELLKVMVVVMLVRWWWWGGR